MAAAGEYSTLTRKQQASEQGRRRKQPVVDEDDSDYDPSVTSDQCPEPNGFFADAEQCDKYYDCRDGRFTEKLCPDGMVFNDYSSEEEKCDLPFNIDCSQRPNRRKSFKNFKKKYHTYCRALYYRNT